MAKVLPVEHYRTIYRAHQSRAALFGVAPREFNRRVASRLVRSCPTPQQWSSGAYLEVQSIAGHRCCPKAVGVPCMCEVSYTCPDHGTRCVGSHD
jgi:hypothetical protein